MGWIQIFLSLFLFALTHIASARNPEQTRVVATVGMIADVVRQVGGDDVQVFQLIGSGIDPHSYRPLRSDAAAILSARVVFYGGFKLEGRLADTLDRLARNGRAAVAVVERIPQEDLIVDHGVTDPHAWMEVRLWMRVVEVVAEELSAAVPDKAEAFRQRAAEYLCELRELEEYIREVISSVPQHARVLITAHDAFRYFGRAYGVEVLGVQGFSTESEAGLERIHSLVDRIVERKIPAVFIESSVSDRNVMALVEGAAARGHLLRLGETLFSDSMGPNGSYEGTYVGMLDHNATAIARALGGAPPEGGFRAWKERRK